MDNSGQTSHSSPNELNENDEFLIISASSEENFALIKPNSLLQNLSQVSIGETGEKGDRGDDGSKGSKGEVGMYGIRGQTGQTGDVGQKGLKGFKGYPGIKGDVGIKGSAGQTGYIGTKGISGASGLDGEVGPKGYKGKQGPLGLKGRKGVVGQQGLKGYSGVDVIGTSGDVGDPGKKVVGATGYKGFKGQPYIGVGQKGERGSSGSEYSFEKTNRSFLKSQNSAYYHGRILSFLFSVNNSTNISVTTNSVLMDQIRHRRFLVFELSNSTNLLDMKRYSNTYVEIDFEPYVTFQQSPVLTKSPAIVCHHNGKKGKIGFDWYETETDQFNIKFYAIYYDATTTHVLPIKSIYSFSSSHLYNYFGEDVNNLRI